MKPLKTPLDRLDISCPGRLADVRRRQFLLAGLLFGLIPGALAVAGTVPTAPPETATLDGVDWRGRRVSLSDFMGEVVLVSFFKSACNLCLHDLKLMREFYHDNHANGFTLIAVSLDGRAEDFRNYSEILSVLVAPNERFPILWREAPEHRDSFGTISREPTHFVLNRSHAVTLRREGPFLPDDWDNLWTLLQEKS